MSIVAEERREEAKKKILEASMDLFMEQGYKKTTIRQIIQRAGILNGSLYYNFRNKEEIFKIIITQALYDALSESEFLAKKTDLLVALTFPNSMELYVSYKSSRIAEFLYEAHVSWDMSRELADLAGKWAFRMLAEHNIQMEEAELHGNMSIALGAVGSMIADYSKGGSQVPYRECIRKMMIVYGSLFGYPLTNVDRAAEQACSILENDDIIVCGLPINRQC